MKRQFVAWVAFVSWVDISLGVSIDLSGPHIDLHLPMVFIRFGFEPTQDHFPINGGFAAHTFGIKSRYNLCQGTPGVICGCVDVRKQRPIV